MLPGMIAKRPAAAGGSSGFEQDGISNSSQMDGSSDYYSWTPAGAGSDDTRFTFRAFVKLGDIGLSTNQQIFFAGSSANNRTSIFYDGPNKSFRFFQVTSGSTVSDVETVAKFRDPCSWYDLCVIYNSNEASSADRVKFFVNGVQQAITETNAVDSARSAFFGTAVEHNIGRYAPGANLFFSGLLADIYYLDGQVGAATDFGEFYSGTEQWRHVMPSGLTYGTNGFHIDFSNAADLGEDQSGNGNDFTTNGTPIQSNDSPTVNYVTLNPLDKATDPTLSNGNLTVNSSATASGWRGCRTTIALPDTGKFRFTVSGTMGSSARFNAGVGTADTDIAGYLATRLIGLYYHPYDGGYYKDSASLTSYGSAYTSGARDFDVFIDMDEQKMWTAVDGTLNGGNPDAATGEMATWSQAGPMFITLESFGGPFTFNFGATGWAHSIANTDDFVGLNAANLPAVSIEDPSEHFNVALWSGDSVAIGSGGQPVTGVNFQPDFTWIKERTSSGSSHKLFDAIRGATKELESDNTAAETTNAEGLASFDADGFTVGNSGAVNASGDDYVAWNWYMGGANAANSDGSTSSTVRANQDAGQSIVSYTGTGSAGTVGHGLLQPPDLIIVKNRDTVDFWPVYHHLVASDPETDYLALNNTSALADDNTRWNDIAPTSSVFSVGTDQGVNGSTEAMIAYCFHSIPGYSKAFAYTGNANTDGPFVYLGFEPEMVLLKNASASGSWHIFDSQREGYNPDNDALFPDLDSAESPTDILDLLSNGFKLRASGSAVNGNGNTVVGIAFARRPLGGINVPIGLAA